MVKTQILKISDIKWDKKIYPRMNYNWKTALKYQNALNIGSKFPPIAVALYNRKYTLIDGKHRIEAFKRNKEKYVTAEILKNLSKNEMYVEAIKRNTEHGFPLNYQERTNIIINLEEMGYDLGKISSIINIPMDKIKPFTANRITSTFDGKSVALKPELKHLAGVSIDDDIEDLQRGYRGSPQLKLLQELNSLISNRLIDIKNKKVLFELRILYKLLKKYKSITK